MVRGSRFAYSAMALVSATLCLYAIGCGGGDGNRLTGNVTFEGKPVPAGKVYFNPDGSKGNTGSSGYADIVDGKYDTGAAGGRGAPTGAVIIIVEGNDPSGAPVDASSEIGTKRLFSGYETTADIAAGVATHDIDVPAEAGKAPAPYVERPLHTGP